MFTCNYANTKPFKTVQETDVDLFQCFRRQVELMGFHASVGGDETASSACTTSFDQT